MSDRVADSAEVGITDPAAAPGPRQLDWLERPLPALLRLAWPIVISMLSASAMALVDTLMVSSLGAWALAGVGLGGISSFILVCFPIGVLGGIKILTSQAVGAGRTDNAAKFLGAGIILALVMAAIATGASLTVAELLPSVSATARTGDAAKIYLQIGALGALPLLIRVAIEQSRLATGDSRSPMQVNVLANCCNAALNYLFIFVLEMGVKGAAYATLLANVIGCVAIILVQARDGFTVRGVRRHHLAGVWRLGLPSGIQFALEMGSFATMVVMLTNLSEIDGAANQIAIQVLHFGFLPCMAIGQAATVMAGQAVGAGRRELVRSLTNKTLIPVTIYASLATLSFLVLGRLIVSYFTDDPALHTLATRLLYIAAAFQIADGINIVARSVLQGTGDVRFCAWAGIVLSWMMTPPLTWLFAYHYGLGALGGWIGLCLDIFVTTAVFWIRVRGSRWHRAADRSLAEARSPDDDARLAQIGVR